MVRIIAGQGRLITRMPPLPFSTSCPVSSTIAAMMPGSGKVQEPGLSACTPGSGVIMWPPVSVCHQVSTIGQRAAADRVVVPHPRLGVDRLADRAEDAQRLDRSYFFGRSPPALISERIAVGAV